MLALVTPEGENLVFKGGSPNHIVQLISTTTAWKCLRKGCNAYLCAVEVTETPGLEPKDIPVVQEFLKVFQEVP